MIKELIEFELREGITNDQLFDQTNKVVNDFLKNQQGFIDNELVSNISNRQWNMIIHYQKMEDIKKVKNNAPHSDALKKFRDLVIPETFNVSFYEQREKWASN